VCLVELPKVFLLKKQKPTKEVGWVLASLEKAAFTWYKTHITS